MKPRYLALGGLGLWLTFGGPADNLAGLFWAERPAPWEKVDAFYYPDRHDLSVHRAARDVKSLDGCRSWVRAMAEVGTDPGMERGDYECGVGKLREMGDVTVYRFTVR